MPIGLADHQRLVGGTRYFAHGALKGEQSSYLNPDLCEVVCGSSPRRLAAARSSQPLDPILGGRLPNDRSGCGRRSRRRLRPQREPGHNIPRAAAPAKPPSR